MSIKSLANHLNIELSNIIAFGDDLNVEQCSYGIAVSNAIEEVLNVADYITDSNDEDGVAKFIEKISFFDKCNTTVTHTIILSLPSDEIYSTAIIHSFIVALIPLLSKTSFFASPEALCNE